MVDLKNIEILTKQYRKIPKKQSWEKLNHYSIITHSTKIEGSTLSEHDTQLLIEEGIISEEKPLEHHNMVTDLYDTFIYALGKAETGIKITPSFLQDLSSHILKTTGSIYYTILHTFDSSKGEFRKNKVFAGNTTFPDFNKVPDLVDTFCSELEKQREQAITMEEQLNLAFDAHYKLVSIHPFADGNGRLSRLIMNYLQHAFNLPLSIVHFQDKAQYITALEETRASNDISIFREFMYKQHEKKLISDIETLLN